MADVIVGAWVAKGDFGFGTGESYVVFGKSDNSEVSLSTLESTNSGFEIYGAGSGDQAGTSVSGAGDVNGDGLMDLVIGATGAYGDSSVRTGESYVIFGKTDSDRVDLSGIGVTHSGFRIVGIDEDDDSGYSVSGAGDVNGDGFADLIIGARLADVDGSISAGESYVVFGKSDQDAVYLSEIGSTHPGFRIDGIHEGDYSGWSVSGAGDVNGDGLSDIIIGASSASPDGISQAGESYVVFGKDDYTAVDLSLLGTSYLGFLIKGGYSGERSGNSVAGAGDVNGDGLGDLIIGANQAERGADVFVGKAYVVFGKTDSSLVDLASLGNGGYEILGIDEQDQTGFSVSGAGDINGDGLADIIIGSPGSDVGAILSAGESFVLFGKTDANTIDLAAFASDDGMRLQGTVEYDDVGYSVSTAGDVDGDGVADIIVGAPSANSQAGETYVLFSPFTPTTDSTYITNSPSGAAPKVGIGLPGGGNGTPDSRCWVDFADGFTTSTLTVTLNRNQSIAASPTIWEISTDRVGWSSASVTFKYTDSEVEGNSESDLVLYKADSPGGPYTPLSSTIDTDRNTISATVDSFSFFAIGTTTGLPVELDFFSVY